MTQGYHIPAMPDEVMHYLNCRPGKIYVDGTLGGSGHASLIAEKIGPDGLLIGIDRDTDALLNAEKVLKPYLSNVRLFHGNYSQLPEFLAEAGIEAVDGIFLDLGLSFHQIAGSGRGFSFLREEPLDMRMNINNEMTAHDLINGFDTRELAQIFKKYGEERKAGRIAKAIVSYRQRKTIDSSLELAEIICGTVPKKIRVKQKIHPATRVFMAIRIAVNRELEHIEKFMTDVVEKDDGALLNPGARLCILSFHSLEDRIVKHRIRDMEQSCVCPPKLPGCACNKKQVLRVLTKKAVGPTVEEVEINPMARSTRLRAAEKHSQ
ncbi:16S rRNA (cytosine(1402)-N(4))-methyltransferase RsmH [Desulfobacterales bacterium HSG16]|nr:16S rRNA (cytosine(1402)-N(4))-methyltransferase RsmH [Desulfobacterales bacterium HSG16]